LIECIQTKHTFSRRLLTGAIRKVNEALSRRSRSQKCACTHRRSASHFRNRVGGRGALVASEIILSARDPSNPRPCLLGTREAKVSRNSASAATVLRPGGLSGISKFTNLRRNLVGLAESRLLIDFARRRQNHFGKKFPQLFSEQRTADDFRRTIPRFQGDALIVIFSLQPM
jgi:hypothetical protein